MLAAVLFQLVTLPVEFNASSRAMDQIVALGVIRNDEERETKKVLSAAALTYVAAAAIAVLELARLILVYTGMQGRLKGKDRLLSILFTRSIGTLFSSSVKPSPMTS